MIIRKIDEFRCDSCSVCVKACMGDIIQQRVGDNKAYIAYSEDCTGCLVCEISCPKQAIDVF